MSHLASRVKLNMAHWHQMEFLTDKFTLSGDFRKIRYPILILIPNSMENNKPRCFFLTEFTTDGYVYSRCAALSDETNSANESIRDVTKIGHQHQPDVNKVNGKTGFVSIMFPLSWH